MGRHGENIRKRSDGRWEGRYPVYNLEKGKKIYRSLYGKSYDEVKEKLFIQKNQIKTADRSDNSYSNKNILFEVAAQEWQVEILSKNKASTCVKYELIYKKYLALTLGKYRAEDINDLILEKWIPDYLSESVQKSIYCVVNQVLEYASQKYGICVKRIKRQSTKAKHRPIEILTKMEQKRLFIVLHQNTDIYKMAVILCLYTGLRLGEVCGLKWTDIDFENQIIYINRTVQRIRISNNNSKTQLLETAPKSEYSKREIPIAAPICGLFRKFKNHKSYIFGGDKPMEPRTMQYRFKKYLREAEIADKKFHILRHTFATNCVEGGADVKSLSEILGHSDVQITLNRYVHPSMAFKRKHLDELSQIYGHFCGQTG